MTLPVAAGQGLDDLVALGGAGPLDRVGNEPDRRIGEEDLVGVGLARRLGLAAQGQRLTGALKTDLERQDNAVFIDEGFDAVGNVAGGYGP